MNDFPPQLVDLCFTFLDDLRVEGQNIFHHLESIRRWPETFQMAATGMDHFSSSPPAYVPTIKSIDVILTRVFRLSKQCQIVTNKARVTVTRRRAKTSCKQRVFSQSASFWCVLYFATVHNLWNQTAYDGVRNATADMCFIGF